MDNLYSYIFVLTEGSFYPYEYYTGTVPGLARVDIDAFLYEITVFLRENNLAVYIGLQIIKPGTRDILEIVILQGTIIIVLTKLL